MEALHFIKPDILSNIEKFDNIELLKNYINGLISSNEPLPIPSVRLHYSSVDSLPDQLSPSQYDTLRYENIKYMIRHLEDELKSFDEIKESLKEGQKLLNPNMILYSCSCCGEREHLQPLDFMSGIHHHPQVIFFFSYCTHTFHFFVTLCH